ncbi:phosphoribosylanthranilate isomerase [Marivirga sp.]|uniref:phosphoribosylanthranilate isomerase n=1 Tax=Marivirga sp. TaxID=2018662 RepID=UPI003DA77127
MMNTPKIKICGMREVENVKHILALQPDFLGFIFYDKSKRFVSDVQMDELMKLGFGDTLAVGVFVNEEVNNILEKANKGYFTHVQLHGDESPDEVKALQAEGLTVIKVFSVGDDFDESILTDYEMADYFLFDTKGLYRGGNGQKFDWSILQRLSIQKPYFLSGGLDVEDVQSIDSDSFPNLVALDFNSRLEIEPGLKDVEKVMKLFTTSN